MTNISNKVECSLISKEYANRFIRTYIMDENNIFKKYIYMLQ